MEYINQKVIERIEADHNLNAREQIWLDTGKALKKNNDLLGGVSV